LQIVKQIAVNAMLRVEGLLMLSEELTRLNLWQEFAQSRGSAI